MCTSQEHYNFQKKVVEPSFDKIAWNGRSTRGVLTSWPWHNVITFVQEGSQGRLLGTLDSSLDANIRI